MKRFLSFALLALFCLVAGVVRAATSITYEEGDITYTLSGTSASVYSVSTSASGAVVIPETVTYEDIEYTVTAIAQNGFKNCSSITTLSLPATIESMGQTAIYGCKALTDIYCYATTVPECSGWLFSNMSSVSLNLWVPCGCKEAYEDYTYKISGINQNVWAPTSSPAVTVGEMACASDVDIDYDNCTPEIDSSSPIEIDEGEAYTFTVAFTDAVILDEDGCYVNMGLDQDTGNVKKESVTIEGVDETGNADDGYTQWNITVSAEVLEECVSEVYIVIAGVDGNGNTLYADDGGYKDISYYYTLVSDNPDLSAYTFSPANESKVTSLSTVEVGYPFVYDDKDVLIGGGIDIDWSNGDAGIANSYIKDASGATVATAKDAEVNYGSDNPNDEEYYYGESVTITYDPEITTPGTYTVVFPATYFLIDGAGTEANSQKFTLTYTIPVDLTFVPESDSTVDSLSVIVVKSKDGQIDYISQESEFTVYKDASATDYLVSTDYEGNAVDSLIFEVAYESWSNPQAIKDAGTYTITFPEGTFTVNGTANEEVILSYTVSGNSVEEGGESGEGEGEGEDEEGGEATGISAIQAAIANGAEVYTISGQKVNAPVSGVNVVKYADGTVKKILQK